MPRRISVVFTAAALMLAAAPQAAHAVTFVNNQGVTITTSATGKLLSAEGVQVGGGLYRVDFGDTLPGSFAFDNAVGGRAAANALLNTVLRNYLVYLPDTVPGLTNGCGLLTITCTVHVPYRLSGSDLSTAYALNAIVEGSDAVDLATVTTSIANGPAATFATFTQTSAVPEPSTWLLMMAGLAVMGLALRRGKQADRRLAIA